MAAILIELGFADAIEFKRAYKLVKINLLVTEARQNDWKEENGKLE